MASITYKLRSNKEGSNIYLRYKYGRKIDITVKTGFIVDSKFWSVSKQKLKPIGEEEFPEINVKLDNLIMFLKKEFNDIKNLDSGIDYQWLKEAILKFKDPNHLDQRESSLIQLILAYRNRFKSVY